MPDKKKTSKQKTKSSAKAVKKAATGKKKPLKKAATASKKSSARKQQKKAPAASRKPAVKKAAVQKKPALKKTTTPTAKLSMTANKTTGKITSITSKTRQSGRTTTDTPDNFKPYKLKSNEEYMGPEQVVHFREILLHWKRDLMEEVDRTVHHMRDEASNFPDPNDRATQEEEFALELRTRDRERKLIKKIDESLMALDSGDYGYCEICGVEIGVRRLEARPTATLCIDCKTLDEIKERQLG